jgi:hypothetical protein
MRGPVPSDRVLRGLGIVVAVASLVAIAIMIGTLYHQGQVNSDQDGRIKAEHRARVHLANLTERQLEALAIANSRLRKAGKNTVHVPDLSQTPLIGPPGARGPGPTPLEVQGAVDAYCGSTGACDGHSPTPSQVFLAVSTFCNSHGQCSGSIGPPGKPGIDGAPGDPGPIGPQGPGPSVDQIASAVQTYCDNHNGCVGPQGPKGDDGTPGSVQSGTYTCPDDTPYVHGFTVDNVGMVTLDCTALPIGP